MNRKGRTEKYLRASIERRKAEGLHRSLSGPIPAGTVDLRSNDHLGLSNDPDLQERIRQAMMDGPFSGSTGSRLISGDSHTINELETEMAAHYGSETGLLFPSGYQANLGLVAAIGGKGSSLLYDERVHASMRDGIRLALAKAYPFAHNDPEALEKKLKKCEGPTYILTEGLFSMEGDLPPLHEYQELAEHYDASLLIDEAHSNGVIGEGGRGLVDREGLTDRTFARVFPFGKAFSQQGAFVTASTLLRSFLIDHARAFIYSTAPSFPSLIALRESFRYGMKAEERRSLLFEKVDRFRNGADEMGIPILQEAMGPVQGVLLEGNEAVQALEERLMEEGLAVKGIRRPTVPAGSERIRIVLHADTPNESIESLLKTLRSTV